MNLTQEISAAAFRNALLNVSAVVQAQEQYLNQLDCAIGDGDHGITMRVGFEAVRKRLLDLPPDAGVDTLLVEAGKSFMRSAGGAIGVILGRALVAAGAAVPGAAQLGHAEFKSCFRAMEKAVEDTGKAKPGDKTLLDPLHALNEALSAFSKETAISELLAAGTAAAEDAAHSTAGMRCRIGRASRLGARALGHPDPGAVSFALIVRALAESITQLSQASRTLQTQMNPTTARLAPEK